MISDVYASFWTAVAFLASGNPLHKIGGNAVAGSRKKEENPDLSSIIEGCRKGNDPARERLYKLYYGYAFSVSMKYCINREDATEVVNDSFIKVFDHIHRFDTSKPFKPWLRKIVVNTSIDKIRKQKKNHLDIEDIPLSGNQYVDADLNIKETLQLLKELPDMYRAVFNLYEIDGYSHKEIAEKLGIGESSSRTYLLRAKNRLRHLYEKHFTGHTHQNA